MKRKLVIILLSVVIAFLASGCGTTKSNPLVGEWKADFEKSGVTNAGSLVSQFQFENDYNMKWLVTNTNGEGTQLLTGTYTASDNKYTFYFDKFVSLDKPMNGDYTIEGNYLKIGGMYYKKTVNLKFVPTT